MYCKNQIKYILAVLALCGFVWCARAATSTDFMTNKEDAGANSIITGTSTDYIFKATIGEPGVGQSTSTDFIYDHGIVWEDGDVMTVTIQWAVPELRVGTAGTNDSVNFYLIVRDPTTHTVLYTSDLATTTASGIYTTQIPLSVQGGTYDIGIKTNQHLAKYLHNILLSEVNTVLNFTQADNSASKGTIALLTGDINGLGNSTTTMGDNVVNSVDISALLSKIDQTDTSSHRLRENLNYDDVVNAVDISAMLKNLDQVGE